ncbi:MAG: prephenate dehydratase, partial [Nitrospinota bacterium]
KPRVSYLGPEATFTHEAALRHFGPGAEFLPAGSIAAVFDEVEAGRAAQGVVPVENALEGTVNVTLDRLIDSPLVITGEVRLPIDIHLLTLASGLRGIRRVLSHPHAVAQCRRWLGENLPEAEVEEVASTSLAAQLAAKDAALAALGSRLAGERYGLRLLVEKLDTESINVTRFFVLGRAPAPRAPRSRTSLLLVVRNEPGSLFRALAPVAEGGVNMTKIESRPSRRKAWDYVFFMDVEGHAEAPPLAGCLARLRGQVEYLRVLGSYPAGE